MCFKSNGIVSVRRISWLCSASRRVTHMPRLDTAHRNIRRPYLHLYRSIRNTSVVCVWYIHYTALSLHSYHVVSVLIIIVMMVIMCNCRELIECLFLSRESPCGDGFNVFTKLRRPFKYNT